MAQKYRRMLKTEAREVVRPPSVWDYLNLEFLRGDTTNFNPGESFMIMNLFTASCGWSDGNSLMVAHPCVPDPAEPATAGGWKRRSCTWKMRHDAIVVS